MLYEKPFLSELYTSSSLNCSKLLSSANEDQIKLLIQILYYLANGIISCPKKCFNVLEESNKISFINKNFGSKRALMRLFKCSRDDQISKLNHLNTSFKELFYPLFNELKVFNKKDNDKK